MAKVNGKELNSETLQKAVRGALEGAVKRLKPLMGISDWNIYCDVARFGAITNRSGQNTVMASNSDVGTRRAHLVASYDFSYGEGPSLEGSFEEVIVHELFHFVLDDLGIGTFEDLLEGTPAADLWPSIREGICDRVGQIVMRAQK